MELQLKQLQKAGSIFGVQIPVYTQLETCRHELRSLKNVWDFIFMVKNSFDNWKMTLWREINGELLETECKKYYKELRMFDKEIRVWDVYLTTDNEIKNMIISLRAIIELQNPAIRERHWQELMKATGVKFSIDESTTFSDMLTLNLHKFEDEVRMKLFFRIIFE